jgi:hypothetical protein
VIGKFFHFFEQPASGFPQVADSYICRRGGQAATVAKFARRFRVDYSSLFSPRDKLGKIGKA